MWTFKRLQMEIYFELFESTFLAVLKNVMKVLFNLHMCAYVDRFYFF